MKFLADINIPQSVIRSLRSDGYNVFDAKKDFLTAPDITLIRYARKNGFIILTRDKDFIALAQFPQYCVPVIVIRFLDQSPAFIRKHLNELLLNQGKDVLMNALTIMREDEAVSYRYK